MAQSERIRRPGNENCLKFVIGQYFSTLQAIQRSDLPLYQRRKNSVARRATLADLDLLIRVLQIHKSSLFTHSAQGASKEKTWSNI